MRGVSGSGGVRGGRAGSERVFEWVGLGAGLTGLRRCEAGWVSGNDGAALLIPGGGGTMGRPRSSGERGTKGRTFAGVAL